MSAYPAARPCGSCPYRVDVPSGVWAESEYELLPGFDGETGDQRPSVFMCHQQDGKICAGWAGCHDMEHSLGLRFAVIGGLLTVEEGERMLDYESEVELFASGAEAAEHGLREVLAPGPGAVRVIERVSAKLRQGTR